ncbi:MAG: hypothetical protein WCG79_05175 [Verrucomicrobiota bacterium]
MKLISRIALAIAIVACIGAGIFAFKLGNSRDTWHTAADKFETEKTKLAKDLGDTRDDLTATKQDLTKTRDELTNTKGELEAGRVALATKAQEVDKLQASLNARAAELAQMKSDRDTAQQAAEDIKKTLADAGTDIGSVAQIGDQIKAQSEENKILGQQLASVRKNVIVCQDKVAALTTTPSNLRGRIAAVQESWGFVIIDIGRDKSIQTNTDFIVSRDSKVVAKVQVRTVGDNTSVAEILPGFPKTLPQVGDAVVHN